ncbi:hypothetical protein JCM11641_003011 [Rhodosporidiobolus odoratus]
MSTDVADDSVSVKPGSASKRARKSLEAVTPAPEVEDKDFANSDDETDAFLFSRSPPKLDQTPEADEVSYRQISITQTAFSTYYAILVYLQIGFIHFISLSSSFPLPNTHSSRDDFLTAKLAENPSLPLPVSPKAASRLSHLLQLSNLQKTSLSALRSSLTVSCCAQKLFSDTSLAYPEVRKVVLDFVKERWDEVKDSERWRAKAELMTEGGLPKAAPVLVESLLSGVQL